MKNSNSYLRRDRPDTRQPKHTASQNILLVLLCGIFLVVGCSNIGKSLTGGSNPVANENQPAVNAKPASSPVELAVQSTQPRGFKYANLQYTVTKAVISVRVADDLPIDNSKPAIADVTFLIVNMAKEDVAIRNGQWQLKLGDGSIYKRPYEDNIKSRDTQERKISFHVPESSQWAGAQISLDEQDKEPATLMLDGVVSPPQYPMTLKSKSDEKTTTGPTITYAIQSANVDLDGFNNRAALGKHYLNLTVHMVCKDGGNEYVPEYFRLLTDGAPSQPENSSDGQLSCPASLDYVMSYIIPASAAVVELEVGKTGEQKTATMLIDLKP